MQNRNSFFFITQNINFNLNMKSKILSCGGYLPSKCLTNQDLETIVETTSEWIETRTGITQRFIVEDNEKTSDMAFHASIEALKMANKTHIDGIIVATTTPDATFPSTACFLQKKLNDVGVLSNFAFDIQAVCSGFVYGMTIANSMIKSGMAKTILLCGADSLSKIVNWKDRETCVLFGDGAGAIVLEETNDEKSGIEFCHIASDGRLSDLLFTTGGVCTQNSGFISMKGKEVFKHAVTKMSNGIEMILQQMKKQKEEVKLVIPHQANERILDAVCARLEMQESQFANTIKKHANTSAATIPLALKEYFHTLNRGDLIILEALGGGLTWGGVGLYF